MTETENTTSRIEFLSQKTKQYCLGYPSISHINRSNPECGYWCDICNRFIECQCVADNAPKILTFNLKKKYFNQILEGTKTEEYREANDFWKKRLKDGMIPAVVEICLGYPDRGDLAKRMWFRGKPIEMKVMSWEYDGDIIEGMTFVIPLGERLAYPYQAVENLV